MSSNKESREARVAHMNDNWDRYKLETYPWGRDRADEARQNRENAMAREMKEKGLYSKTTVDLDIRGAMPGLIEEARNRRADGK